MILKNNLESIDYNNFAKHSTQQVSNLIQLDLLTCGVHYGTWQSTLNQTASYGIIRKYKLFFGSCISFHYHSMLSQKQGTVKCQKKCEVLLFLFFMQDLNLAIRKAKEQVSSLWQDTSVSLRNYEKNVACVSLQGSFLICQLYVFPALSSTWWLCGHWQPAITCRWKEHFIQTVSNSNLTLSLSLFSCGRNPQKWSKSSSFNLWAVVLAQYGEHGGWSVVRIINVKFIFPELLPWYLLLKLKAVIFTLVGNVFSVLTEQGRAGLQNTKHEVNTVPLWTVLHLPGTR